MCSSHFQTQNDHIVLFWTWSTPKNENFVVGFFEYFAKKKRRILCIFYLTIAAILWTMQKNSLNFEEMEVKWTLLMKWQ